jgi:hypothetical protein
LAGVVAFWRRLDESGFGRKFRTKLQADLHQPPKLIRQATKSWENS